MASYRVSVHSIHVLGILSVSYEFAQPRRGDLRPKNGVPTIKQKRSTGEHHVTQVIPVIAATQAPRVHRVTDSDYPTQWGKLFALAQTELAKNDRIVIFD